MTDRSHLIRYIQLYIRPNYNFKTHVDHSQHQGQTALLCQTPPQHQKTHTTRSRCPERLTVFYSDLIIADNTDVMAAYENYVKCGT